ncbi:siderophore-interacting protein [Janibacter cremeus]|uniref:NADPH-dependent ferric siderophore reductase n=1 Tax=Janibacter cremeus TaxID=1285192 RepID=A0A852VPM9_9MICO|nr:siderophore-interacting protein [Janibacter cremeus]NYF98922.1 NADPH-dependent ferric siderophore reductase [Janibacter cremeus]
MAAPARKPRPQHVLTVDSTQQLGPHLVRVVLTGDSLADFGAAEHTDAYVKLIFVDPALGLEPPYDLAALRESLPAAQQPVTRTYTVRAIDRAARRLTLDFVTHGDTGYAGPWAMTAQPGDSAVVRGPGGAYSPRPDVDWHLMAGDLSAMPAIAAALESLPSSAKGVVLLEVEAGADALDITAPEGVEVSWLVNPDTGDADFLARAIDAAPWPTDVSEGAVQVFAHGERESIKAVRRVLKQREVPRGSISISGYWARGRTEDVFQAEKKTPVGMIED